MHAAARSPVVIPIPFRIIGCFARLIRSVLGYTGLHSVINKSSDGQWSIPHLARRIYVSLLGRPFDSDGRQ